MKKSKVLDKAEIGVLESRRDWTVGIKSKGEKLFGIRKR